jgi:hypothetical protein
MWEYIFPGIVENFYENRRIYKTIKVTARHKNHPLLTLPLGGRDGREEILHRKLRI